MIRLLLHLLGIKNFDTCKSCQTLKEQLEFERSEKKQLTETLLSIVRPKVYEAPPIELQPIATTSGSFARRRAALEEKDRQEAQILREKKHIGMPDNPRTIGVIENITVEGLEHELGIEEKEA
jgi:hypothetical protein